MGWTSLALLTAVLLTTDIWDFFYFSPSQQFCFAPVRFLHIFLSLLYHSQWWDFSSWLTFPACTNVFMWVMCIKLKLEWLWINRWSLQIYLPRRDSRQKSLWPLQLSCCRKSVSGITIYFHYLRGIKSRFCRQMSNHGALILFRKPQQSHKKPLTLLIRL